MKNSASIKAALLIGLFASHAAYAQVPSSGNQLAESFNRMLAHTPTPTAQTATANSPDPLLDHLVATLQPLPPDATPIADNHTALSGVAEHLVIAIPEDRLAASFQRMLGHSASAAESPHATESGHDPLLQHLAAALHRESASATPKMQHR
jgi:hypothetical protein